MGLFSILTQELAIDLGTANTIIIYNESLARMEKMIEMGFTEGFKMSMSNLEDLLETVSKK